MRPNIAEVALDAGMRRRRDASSRCPPLEDGRRDPLNPCGEPQEPGHFGLNRDELFQEVRRLQVTGWSLWEIRRRFGAPPSGDRS